ncbi:PRC-barrel domain protein [Serpentinicella alkaliphila]|uniref:PRC-barrel domain protein n=1 Tax=Serpentinicella alkaliphila TaxID=1734049 RepID=A0A4V2T473_9FIRM|nr:PRC-barrel domain protein [Serpentinicella alkaliphila]
MLRVDELPIIIESRGVVGKLEGFVYEGLSIVALYCKIDMINYHIPINEVIIGKDSIILKDSYGLKYLNVNNLKYVYDISGEKIGTLQQIELDEEYNISSIIVDDTKILAEHLVAIDPTIVINLNLNKQAIEVDIVEEKEEVDSDVVEIEQTFEEDKKLELEVEEDISVQDAIVVSLKSNDEIIDTEGDVQVDDESNTLYINEDHCIFNSPIETIMTSNGIISKYEYLNNKKLEEPITINRENYIKGHIIDYLLIEKAIYSNEIVKLVMAAEE